MGDSDDFKVTEKQLCDARGVFSQFDKKKSGCVLAKDIAKVFKSLGLIVSDEKVKKWTDEMDDEATGALDFDQFGVLFKRKLKEDVEEKELREAFRVLDQKNKGQIDVDILRWILKSLGDDLDEDDIQQMIDDVDADGSGAVDYDEFRSLMMSSD